MKTPQLEISAAVLQRLGLTCIDARALDIDIHLIYASTRNFTHTVIYDYPLCLLRPQAYQALARAANKARSLGFRLRVLDAFRSQRAQETLWSVAPDPDYVADPKEGSNHTRGVAVDVTLLDASGTPLNMGTEVDTMHPDSHHFCARHADHIQKNRMYLLTAMLEGGFVHHPKEWWHYQLPDAHSYSLIAEDPLMDANHPLPEHLAAA
jgi:zinc D-Ala-D-Ala dipeptidase